MVTFHLITIKLQFLCHTSHILLFQWTHVGTVAGNTVQPTVVSLGYVME